MRTNTPALSLWSLGLVFTTAALLSACAASSPTSPSQTAADNTGASIQGLVTGAAASAESSTRSLSALALPAAVSPMAGVVVSVAGTGLSAIVGDSGTFQIDGVPPGAIRLLFKGGNVDANLELSPVVGNQFIQLQVQLSETSAVVVNEVREGKVALCHAEGNGSYHEITVSQSAELDHRGHGDAKIGEPVPGQPTRIFDADCRPVGPSVRIEKSTNGDDADSAPGPSIPVGSPVKWEYRVTNDGTLGLTAVLVADDQGVTVTCGGQTTLAVGASMTCTADGLVTEMGPYRNVGTVTANWSSQAGSGVVTDSDPSHYLGVSSIQIEKWTNGEDADAAPGPEILVGEPVSWEYRLTNIGILTLTGIAVTDDREGAPNCGGQTTLAPGASFTCTASGVAELGQYANLATATASWSTGPFAGLVTDSDASHYWGVSPDDDEPKVTLCHSTGAGFFVKISVSSSAEPAHRDHGDAGIGQAVPGQPGKTFSQACVAQ